MAAVTLAVTHHISMLVTWDCRPYMPVVCEGFQQSLNDGSLPWQSKGLQVESQGLVDAKSLKGKCPGIKYQTVHTYNKINLTLFFISVLSSLFTPLISLFNKYTACGDLT